MKTSTEVERWFAEKKLPAEATMRRVRETILRADRRMTELVKYGTVTSRTTATSRPSCK